MLKQILFATAGVVALIGVSTTAFACGGNQCQNQNAPTQLGATFNIGSYVDANGNAFANAKGIGDTSNSQAFTEWVDQTKLKIVGNGATNLCPGGCGDTKIYYEFGLEEHGVAAAKNLSKGTFEAGSTSQVGLQGWNAAGWNTSLKPAK